MPNDVSFDFDIFAEEPSVHIFAMTTDQKVILVREFRPGPEKYLVELPAGGVEPGEEHSLAAARELLEETGYRGDMQHVANVFRSPYSNAILHIYVSRNCEYICAPAPDENEFLETVLLSLRDFRRLLKTGEMTNAVAAYLALDYLQML